MGRLLLTYSFIGALAVLIIMNAKNFSTAASVPINGGLSWISEISGSGYKVAK
jgi:hypothetical protein